jgi:translocation and assembly module TamB
VLLGRAEAPHEAAIHAEPIVAGPEPSLALTPRATPLGGELTYRYDPEWVDVEPGHFATDRVYVEFDGRTAYGDEARFPFYARSADWQEGDRLLAGIITAFGSPTGVIKVGGWGEFQGTLLESFRRPRVVGTFTGDGTRAWDVVWGRGRAEVVIENGYVDVTKAVMTSGASEIRAEGRFSLGYPRKDGGEEIDARVTIKDRPLKDLRHAFELDDWPVEGKLSGEYHLWGHYTGPFGFGNVVLTEMTAWAEPFDGGKCALRFEGGGVRVDGLEIRKSGGLITGAAYVGWDGRYSFNADGRRIPVESIAAVKYEPAPLSGVAQFTANGSSTFLVPKWDLDGRIEDLFISDEGIGLLTGHLAFREELLTLELEAASPRLAVSGTGQIELTPTADANLAFRFTNTSLDPYIRALQPKMSPFTRAEATGAIRVVGQLANLDNLMVEATADNLALRLFDYDVRNEGPVRFVLDRNLLRVGVPAQAPPGEAGRPVVLVGKDTRLEVSGTADLKGDRVDLRAVGDANLAILQAFFRDIRTSGRARLVGGIRGQLKSPVLSGNADITDGRIRYFGLPHSIQNINGRLTLGANGIQMEDVRAQVANGNVRFGGRIELNGLVPGQLSLTATGENMDLRYPAGFRSIVDAQLDLVGTFAAPTLKGEVTVKSATYRNRFDLGPGLFELAAGRAPAAPPSRAPGTLPLRFDLHVGAPSSLRIDTNVLRMVASADLFLRGNYDRPLLFGRAEVEQGEAIFEGKRYMVTSGTVDFTNPTKIEPFFDLAAETRVRAPGQTYIVDIHLMGTLSHLQPPQLSSDPPLPPLEIITLLFGDATRATGDAELRAVEGAAQDRASLATSRVQQALVGTAISPVTSAVERAAGLETFQITPNFFDPYQRVAPTARLTVGKRISDKVYLTFSRSINMPGNDLVVLLEYDQSPRLSWIVSRNEDGTYALDARVRHTF